MKSPRFLLAAITLPLTSFSLSAAEYGGRWTDESIRERSQLYIERTKADFDERAVRLAEVIDFEVPLQYREFEGEALEIYERYLDDRINERDRKRLMAAILEDLAKICARLVEAEQRAFVEWEKLPKEVKEEKAAMVEGEIYGTKVTASNLGVVLDNSPSMRDYLPSVRAEIEKSFPEAHYRESAGSGLFFEETRDPKTGKYVELDDSWFYGELPIGKTNPFDPKWHQNRILPRVAPHYRQVRLERNPLSALSALVRLQEVDSLYWFCDFEDDIDPKALESLSSEILSRGVKFFVHSSNRRPDKALVELVEESGGEVIRKRIR